VPTVIAHHDVKDKDRWLASPKREEVFGPLGVTNIRTFVDPQNPTQVALLMDVADLNAVMGAMQTKGRPTQGNMTACCPRRWSSLSRRRKPTVR
jgi:hypothetical protein